MRGDFFNSTVLQTEDSIACERESDHFKFSTRSRRDIVNTLFNVSTNKSFELSSSTARVTSLVDRIPASGLGNLTTSFAFQQQE